MLIETLIICAITNTAPFYDCPPEYDGVQDFSGELWTVKIYSWDAWKHCKEFESNACVKWKESTIHISINQPLWKDSCGWNTLWHELNHLKTKDPFYCHEHKA